MIMKYLKAVFVTVFYLSSFTILCQISPPTNYDWKVKYKKSTKTYFRVDRNEPLSNLDKGSLKSREETSVIEKYYTPHSNMPVTVIKKVDSKNVYRDNMIRPTKLVIDGKGIHAYGNRGKKIKMIKHTGKYSDLTKFKSGEVFLSFPVLMQKDIRKIRQRSGRITLSKDGVVTAVFDSGTLIYDPIRRTRTLIKNDRHGEPIKSTFTQYAPITSLKPGYSNPDDVLPIYSKEVVKEKLPSGVCVDFVNVKTYSEYDIHRGGKNKFDRIKMREEVSNDALFFPNPITNEVNVKGLGKGRYDLTIFNISGKLVFKNSYVGSVRIDMSDFSKGVYIISLKSDSEEHISKLIKK